MFVDPQTIENIRFKTTRVREGYDQDEVDNFLDGVALTLRSALDSNGNLEAERGRLKARCDALQRALDARDEARTVPVPVVQHQMQQTPGEAASRLLDMAQKTADDIVAQANEQARDIVAQAVDSSEEIIGRATDEADARRVAAEEATRQAEEKLAAVMQLKNEARGILEVQLTDLRDKLGE